jgi:uncharacterized alpha-E superfamily protein
MLSRIAESLYWIGRYVERAEDTARITDVNYHHTLEMGALADAPERRRRHWEALVSIVGDADRFAASYSEANEETVPQYLIFDAANPHSVVSCMARARENARMMRHQIASEMWEILNRFYLDLQQRRESGDTPVGAENAHEFYRWVIEFSHLFQGITDSTMPREEGWYFLQAGKFLERAEKTARALDVKYHLLAADAAAALPEGAAVVATDGIPGDSHQWLAVLRSMSAYEAYHKIYRSAVRPRGVIELLTLSPIFPRSIRFAIGEVAAALAQIAAHQSGLSADVALGAQPGLFYAPGMGSEAERAVGRLRGTLAYQRVEEVFDSGLREYLLDLERQCFQIGELIEGQYFAHRAMRVEEVLA